MSAAEIAQRTDPRARIVEVAEKLFREIGYQKTTVADIAKALRMSPANVYRFFDSKKAINEAVAERCTDQISTAARAIAASDRPAAERIRDILRMNNRMVTELGTVEAKMLEMVEVAMTENWGVIRAHIEAMNGILADLVGQGFDAGEFSVPSPEIAGWCIGAAMIRYCHPAMIAQCADLPRPTLDEQIDFVMVALGGPASGR
jgi:AcrR family transcriptional regulator